MPLTCKSSITTVLKRCLVKSGGKFVQAILSF